MPLNVTFDYNFNELPPLDDGDHKSAVKLTSYMQNDKRRISMPPKDCSAVEVRRLRYIVGSRSKPKTILSGINMTVPEGAIYGLLGPSGSGKTTLLKSVVGQLTPTEGWVKVFGFQPNQPGSQIPGSAIGYMPQELAVYEDFTIKETLWYFGRLYRIPKKTIKERIEFLLTFLDLPRSKRLILNMSGGQKRRVSLASALVHSPPLLILDEPTVGVDPLLRQSIWQHLVTLTQTEKITVIVTTHYIEEARRANIVGLMRRGKLLAENTPDDLMAKHDSTSLEDVFLKLCVSDTMRRAQKFASFTGIPVQAAIMATSSAIPSPEIGSKRGHYAVDQQVAALSAVDAQPTDEAHREDKERSSEAKRPSGASESPDEGVNSHLSRSSGDGSASEDSSSSKSVQTASAGTPNDNTEEGSDGALAGAGNGPEQLASPVAEQDNLQVVVDKSVKESDAGKDKSVKSAIASNSPPKQTEKPNKSRRFHLRSIFKKSADSGGRSDGDEKRRQSGSHFIEQLMHSYPRLEIQGQPIDQVLSCDTNNRQFGGQMSRLKVPKISVNGSHGDSGASSNGSSQNHSPAGNNNLISSAYQNYTYQTSECGSTYNDMALIATANGSYALDMAAGGSPKRIVDDSDLDEVALNPDLFMNPADLSTMSPGNKYDYKTQSVSEYCDTIGTITWKNYIRLRRNVPLLLFQFLLPAIQVILFCICVGNDPFDVSVAVVNEESSADSVAALSSQFLRSVDSHLVRQVNFSNLELAIRSVRKGENWGVIHIPENFTISIHKRFSGLEGEIDDATLENSTIKVYPDMTNQPIGHAMEVAFRRAYKDLSRQTFEFLGLNPALSDPPIRMEESIYGKLDLQNYLQYMSPGVLISISYIMATGLTSLAFIIERRDGLYDRTLAAGVQHIQMLISHSIIQLVVMTVQISLVVFFTFVIYKVPSNGPFVWVFSLLLLQGLAGMSFGLMVSAICREENTAIMMILGTFYPNLLLAGVIWPIEAIPYWLRWFSYLQPQTLPTQALRNLIVRGWSIDQPGVWSGFAVTSIWLLVFLMIACVAFKIRK